MQQLKPIKKDKDIQFLVIFSSITFIMVYLINISATAASAQVDIGWSIILTAVKSYCAILGVYFCIRFHDIYISNNESSNWDFILEVRRVLKPIQNLFAALIGGQMFINTASFWIERQLFPLEKSVGESILELTRYAVGSLGMMILESYMWFGQQLRLSFLDTNPCIKTAVGTFCLQDYPWAAAIIASLFVLIIQKLWKIKLFRDLVNGTVRLVVKLITALIRLIGKIISSNAAKNMTVGVFIYISKKIWSELRLLYISQEEIDAMRTNLPSISKTV